MKRDNIILALSLFAVAFVLFVGFGDDKAVAGAPSGLPATYFSGATQVTVGPSLVFDPVATTTGVRPVLFQSNDRCSARVISTGSAAIHLAFVGTRSSTTVSSSIGHWQGASTTVIYDSGQVGCGSVQAWALTSTTVQISEFR